jgi:hypothetical protein
MNISPQVEMILEVLKQYTIDGLRDEALFANFMQHAQVSGKQEALGALAFHGKYLRNLYITVQRQTQGSELYGKLEQEFSRAVKDFHGMVGEFITDADEDFRVTVEQQALEVSENGLKSLLSLAEDFGALKNLELDVLQNETDTNVLDVDGVENEDEDEEDEEDEQDSRNLDSEEADADGLER